MTNRMNEYRYTVEVQLLSKPWGTAGFEDRETEATSEVTSKESILKPKVDDQLSNAVKRLR